MKDRTLERLKLITWGVQMHELFYITLLELEGVGRKTVLLVRDYINKNSISLDQIDHTIIIDIFKRLRENNIRMKIPNEYTCKAAKERAYSIIERSRENGINIITIDDKRYPKEFKEINSPPIVYYYKGNHKLVHSDEKAAIIGTRYPTTRGKNYAYSIAKYLTEMSYTIVSGLAIGCDTYGHLGAVENNGATIATLPSDLMNVYPKENAKLSEEIIGKSGCLISEYPIGNKLSDYQFIERDRLQAALSKVVIVIETGINSGTMHTVKYTRKYNKRLACLEYPEYMKNYKSIQGNETILKKKGVIRISDLADLHHIKDI